MQWLRRNPLAVLLTLAAAACIASGIRTEAAGGPAVVRDTQASTDPYAGTLASMVQPNTEIEPSIAVNPANSNNVVTVFQEGRVDAGGDADNGYATSFDGGK